MFEKPGIVSEAVWGWTLYGGPQPRGEKSPMTERTKTRLNKTESTACLFNNAAVHETKTRWVSSGFFKGWRGEEPFLVWGAGEEGGLVLTCPSPSLKPTQLHYSVFGAKRGLDGRVFCVFAAPPLLRFESVRPPKPRSTRRAATDATFLKRVTLHFLTAGVTCVSRSLYILIPFTKRAATDDCPRRPSTCSG